MAFKPPVEYTVVDASNYGHDDPPPISYHHSHSYPDTSYSSFQGSDPRARKPLLTDEKRQEVETLSVAASDEPLANEATHYEEVSAPMKSLLSKAGSTVSFIAGILWLAPAIYLLYINVIGEIVGASAWCPGNHCNVITYYIGGENKTYYDKAAEADSHDHLVLGALQFTAKAMEVWFGFVAAGLVYLMSCVLARRNGGLPLGYILTHLEFADLSVLFDPNFWTSARNPRRTSMALQRQHTLYLYTFVTLVAILCIVTNMMGPSVAVLMIPTINWVDSPHQAIQLSKQVGSNFHSTFAATSPVTLPNIFAIPGCTPLELADGNLSCTANTYGAIWDAIVDTSTALNEQYPAMTDYDPSLGAMLTDFMYAPSNEFRIPFAFNMSIQSDKTSISAPQWAPNRQVLREISEDFKDVYHMIRDGTASQSSGYNNSLELNIQRQGPILGYNYSYGAGQYFLQNVGDADEDKYVQCVLGYAYINETDWSKCYQIGTTWNATNSYATFNISDLTLADSPDLRNSHDMRVSFFWTEEMVYFKGNDSSSLPTCFLDPHPGCDWKSLFAQPTPPGFLETSKRPTLVGTYEFPNYVAPDGLPDSYTWITEYFPHMGIATYSLDVTTIAPTLAEIEIVEFPQTLTPVTLNADWMLAAWSVDTANNGFGDSKWSSISTSTRSAALKLQWAYRNLQDEYNGVVPQNMEQIAMGSEFYSIVQFSGLQALSMVPYNVTQEPVSTDGDDTQETHPTLHKWLHRKVWKFGLDSHTSRLGVAFMCMGMLTVLARSVLFILARTREHSTVALIASAIRHMPNDEFQGMDSDKELSRVRMRMQDHNVNGHIIFEKVL